MTLMILLLQVVTIKAWDIFYREIFKVEENGNFTLVLFPFYVFYMLSLWLTSVLYGLDDTNYFALKSLLGNILFSITQSLTLINILPVTLLSVTSSCKLFSSRGINTLLSYFFGSCFILSIVYSLTRTNIYPSLRNLLNLRLIEYYFFKIERLSRVTFLMHSFNCFLIQTLYNNVAEENKFS